MISLLIWVGIQTSQWYCLKQDPAGFTGGLTRSRLVPAVGYKPTLGHTDLWKKSECCHQMKTVINKSERVHSNDKSWGDQLSVLAEGEREKESFRIWFCSQTHSWDKISAKNKRLKIYPGVLGRKGFWDGNNETRHCLIIGPQDAKVGTNR